MQIGLALLIGAVIGLASHYLLPHRASRGVLVVPMIGAATSTVAWAVLTWAGLGIEDPWIWLAAIVAPTVLAVPAALLLSGARVRGDEKERTRLGIG